MPIDDDLKSEDAHASDDATMESVETVATETAANDSEILADSEGEGNSGNADTDPSPILAQPLHGDLSYDEAELRGAIEALVFAAGEPISFGEVRRVFKRLWKERDESWSTERLTQLKELYQVMLEEAEDSHRGFRLVAVGEGLTFRSNPKYATVIQAVREQRPARLSRAALETMAIVAYRQPATKPEIDYIRGVDCGGTIRLLLEKNLIRIVGKREEPGRPLLYGTTKEFLNFFNLRSLKELPDLKEFNELTDESQQELAAFDGVDIEALKSEAPDLLSEDESTLDQLDEAVDALKHSQRKTADAFEEAGVTLDEDVDQMLEI